MGEEEEGEALLRHRQEQQEPHPLPAAAAAHVAWVLTRPGEGQRWEAQWMLTEGVRRRKGVALMVVVERLIHLQTLHHCHLSHLRCGAVEVGQSRHWQRCSVEAVEAAQLARSCLLKQYLSIRRGLAHQQPTGRGWQPCTGQIHLNPTIGEQPVTMHERIQSINTYDV